MADLKISQLTSATLPLAGTEVLPIVQSSSTKKVATNDLTVRNVRSNATTGILQVTGPTASQTRVMTTPDANFTIARIDAANSFTADQTLATGNLIQGTAAKGINFTANTFASGMTSQLLNWYEEGTWTPIISGSTTAGTGTYSVQTGSYTRIGNRLLFSAYIAWSAHTGTGNMRMSGLPFVIANNNANFGAVTVFMNAAMALTAGNMLQIRTVPGSASLFPLQVPTGGGAPSQVPLPTSGSIMITGHYYV